MLLNKEVICLRDMDNREISDVLQIYTKSIRPFFSFKICGLGVVSFGNSDDDYETICVNHWVKTIWPLLAAKVLYLEFSNTVEFIDGILPAILNETVQLSVLKIHNLQYSPKEELLKVKRLLSLKKLTLDNFSTHHIDKDKLLGIIPKQLSKIFLKSLLYSSDVIEDLTKVLNHCSSNLETLELIDIDVTPALMQSISSIDGMRLKKFSLVLLNSPHYDQESGTLLPLFKTQWPLKRLTLCSDGLNDNHLKMIFDTFKNVKKVIVSTNSETSNMTGGGSMSFHPVKKVKNFYKDFV